MGQYYITVNIDKKQFLHPHKFNEGLKLLEFGCSSEGTLLGLALLTCDGNNRGGGDLRLQEGDDPRKLVGSWAGDRIVVAGDYADGGRFLNEELIQEYIRKASLDPDTNRFIEKCQDDPDWKPNLYAVARDIFEDISRDVIKLIAKDEYCKFAPTEHNFKEILELQLNRYDKYKRPEYNYKDLSVQDMGAAFYDVIRNGEAFFKGFKEWVLKLPLERTVKTAVKAYEFKRES